MKLPGLVGLLPELPAFTEWLSQLKSGQRDGTAGGAAGRAAYLVAGLAAQVQGPILLITARSEMAQQLVDQLLIWLPPLEAGGAPIYQFADPDALPYERIPWSGTTRQRRLTALAALQQRAAGAAAPIVVVSARALMQKTLPARELRMALRTLKAGAARAPGADDRCAGCRPATTRLTSSKSRASLPGAAVLSTSGRRTCRALCASTCLATRWRACACLTRPRSAPCARSSSVDIGPGSEVLSKYGPAMLERLNVHGEGLMAPENVGAPDEEGSSTHRCMTRGCCWPCARNCAWRWITCAAARASTVSSGTCPTPTTQPVSLLDHLGADGLGCCGRSAGSVCDAS